MKKNTKEHLFYAAFELRCGIEARMREYLEARKEVAEKRKRDWEITKLGRTIQRALKVTDKVAVIRLTTRDGLFIGELRHVPVSKKLQDMGKKLGDLLHAQQDYIPSSDRWWVETRLFLREVCDQLRTCCLGTILAPPLLNRKTNSMDMTIVPNGRDVNDKTLKRIRKMVGATCLADISYEEL